MEGTERKKWREREGPAEPQVAKENKNHGEELGGSRGERGTPPRSEK